MSLDSAGVYVWKIIELNRTEIASGDSKGQVIIWDSINFIETARFTEHKADITALCAGDKGKDTLYATGIDSKITSMAKTESKGWVYTSCIRGQSHDINAICMVGGNEIISGGVTTDICIYPIVNGRFKESYGASNSKVHGQGKLRHVPPFPMRSPIALTKNNEILLLQMDSEMQLWSVPSLVEPPKLQVVIKKKKGNGIYSSQISPDGKYFCYSDVNGLCLYQLFSFNPVKLSIPYVKNCQVCLQFSADSLYSVSVDGILNVLDLSHEKLSQYPLKDPDTHKKFSVQLATISPTFEWLLFSTNENLVWTYNLSTKEIAWKVPYTGIPTCLKCFDDSRAIVVGDKNEVLIYDLAHKALDPWTRHQGKNLPANYLDRFNRIYDIVQINSHKFILYTHYTFIVLDTEAPVPKYSRCVTNKSYVFNKSEEDLKEAWAKLVSAHQGKVIKTALGEELVERKTRENEIEESKGSGNDNMAIYNKYSVILAMKYDENEKRLFVVESPWSKILKTFPGTLQVHKYGNQQPALSDYNNDLFLCVIN
eukprot:TRINITY_DN562_c0_g1_i6.p1 TRINITY_DN562_c0_g1~~TRINITY_DN562_c0_g1_i6.p1  ORF type:complete len:538 (-),score=34.43 TRINITY_DN562_c0_g1_i6:5528-7141(-)